MQRTALPFDRVTDPRAHRSAKQPPLWALLRLVVVGICCGKRTWRAVEDLSQDMTGGMRKALGLNKGRISDTALYELIRRLLPWRMKQVVTLQMKGELERKGITNDRFSGGVISYDGKKTADEPEQLRPNGFCLQTFRGDPPQHAWELRSLRSCLTSSAVRPVLNQTFLPNLQGEATCFRRLFNADVRTYPRLFRYVTADAGLISRENAQLIRAQDKHYLFAVKGNQRWLLERSQQLLDGKEVCFSAPRERYRGQWVSRQIVRKTLQAVLDWCDASQVLKVITTRTDDEENVTSTEERYYITSIPPDELSDEQLLQLVRLHWDIENGPHWTKDVIFNEDAHCMCKKEFGPAVMSWLYVIAYNVLALMRAHLPKRNNRPLPWRRVVERLYQVYLTHQPTNELIATLA